MASGHEDGDGEIEVVAGSGCKCGAVRPKEIKGCMYAISNGEDLNQVLDLYFGEKLGLFSPHSLAQETSSEGNDTLAPRGCAMTRSGWQVPTGSSVKYMAVDGTPLDSS